MVERWAMLRNGRVENVCLWDGSLSTWQPPDGIKMIRAPDHIGIDWKYENQEWWQPDPVLVNDEQVVDVSAETNN